MSNETLKITLVTYADNSLRINESHVALAVEDPNGEDYHLFHATEDLYSESDMMYEMQTRKRDPLQSNTTHQMITINCSVTSNEFDAFKATMESVPVPKPKPKNWNRQSWLQDALIVMERRGWLRRGMAGQYYRQMMSTIKRTSVAM